MNFIAEWYAYLMLLGIASAIFYILFVLIWETKFWQAICPRSVRGEPLPYGLSLIEKEHGRQDWPFGALCLRLPLLPYWSRYHYAPRIDEFQQGWMLGILMLQFGRAPIWGVITFQIRLVIGSYGIGRQKQVSLSDFRKA